PTSRGTTWRAAAAGPSPPRWRPTSPASSRWATCAAARSSASAAPSAKEPRSSRSSTTIWPSSPGPALRSGRPRTRAVPGRGPSPPDFLPPPDDRPFRPPLAGRQSVPYILTHMVQSSGPRLDASFAALSDATRRGVLERLGRADASITDLAEKFHMTLTGMKKHVGVLEQAGLVATEKVGRVRTC